MKNKRYAIVDIETTGGFASTSKITEIAILIFNGTKVIEEYSTLVNPNCFIPFQIQALTGISNSMVSEAPQFKDIAEDIYHLLGNCIFVAHNVHFDYSFIQNELKQAGYDWKAPKLCTVRLSRKIFKNLPSYSLGKLCQSLGVVIEDRHRAYGDAKATVTLFKRLYDADQENFINVIEKSQAKEQRLPTHIPAETIEKLPLNPGIYIFKNRKGKIIYVGKAINIKKRVVSHFTGNNNSERRQQFINEIAEIDFKESGTELMALLMECSWIKKTWPIYNKSLKKYDAKYGLISYEDQNGFLRLCVCELKKHIVPLFSFNTVLESTQFLLKLIQEYDLHFSYCAFFNSKNGNTNFSNTQLATPIQIDPGQYNEKVLSAIHNLQNKKRSFVILDKGRNENEKSYVYYKENNVYAIGFIDNALTFSNFEDVTTSDQLVSSNFYMNRLAEDFAQLHPERIKILPDGYLEDNFYGQIS